MSIPVNHLEDQCEHPNPETGRPCERVDGHSGPHAARFTAGDPKGPTPRETWGDGS